MTVKLMPRIPVIEISMAGLMVRSQWTCMPVVALASCKRPMLSIAVPVLEKESAAKLVAGSRNIAAQNTRIAFFIMVTSIYSLDVRHSERLIIMRAVYFLTP